MESVYVFGHTNPDTDTICAAIAYANLKNKQTGNHVPVRLGDLNRETRFVLNTFGVPEPDFLPHIHLRVQDAMTTEPIKASADATIYEIGTLLRKHRVAAVPIVDGDGRMVGAVSERSLARSYLNELQVQNLSETPTELGKIADTLKGALLVGNPTTQVRGNALIGDMSPESMTTDIQPGDIMILGNRENGQEAAISSGIACLIVTRSFVPSTRIQERAREQGVAIIVTPHDTFGAARMINLSVPVQRLLESNVPIISPESLVSDITRELLESEIGIALVGDEDGRLVGLLTNSNVLARRRRKVVLVDHSERSQSAAGIDQADIVEIIDHHRLGGLETAAPMSALIAPVGCTSTLVLRRYRESGVVPSRDMAGIMLSAILSDTVLLKSPTTTPEDEAAVEYLGRILGEDPLAYGVRMYNAKFDMAALPPGDIATNDLKAFEFGPKKVGIGQVEVADRAMVLERKADILAAMEHHQVDHGFELQLLMVTDIVQEGTELLAVGNTRAVERAFGKPLQDHSVYLPGVLSRKKQIVPALANAV